MCKNNDKNWKTLNLCMYTKEKRIAICTMDENDTCVVQKKLKILDLKNKHTRYKKR